MSSLNRVPFLDKALSWGCDGKLGESFYVQLDKAGMQACSVFFFIVI